LYRLLISRLKNEKQDKSKLYQLYYEIIIQNKGFSSPEEQMKKISKIAGEMLKKRSNFIEINDGNQELESIVKVFQDRPLGIFVEEFKDNFAFSHQSLQEFILAWSISQEIKTKKYDLLLETPSFDYVGAETYNYLNDLPNVKEELANEIKRLSIIEDFEKSKWNNLTRNLFEAIGMLAVCRNKEDERLEDERLIEIVVNEAQTILNSEHKNKIYVFYKTKYNIVRCLERLHPSSPKPYVCHILDWVKEEMEPDMNRFGAYAIRGFHLSKPTPGYRPSMVFEENGGCDKIRDLEKEVSECLLSIIEELNNKEELSQDADFLRLNCTFALIRWLPHNFTEHNRLLNLLEADNFRDSDNIRKYFETNIFWVLYRRFGKEIPDVFHKKFTIKELKLASSEAEETLKRLIS